MSISMHQGPFSMVNFQAVPTVQPGLSIGDRLHAWVARKTRARLARHERALIARHAGAGSEGDAEAGTVKGEVLTLDGQRGTPETRLARLRARPTGSIDAVVSVGALAGATDVGATLQEIQRVLRSGGRLIFVEAVTAPAGTRLRGLQRTFDWLWRLLAGSPTTLRDLWNDLKAARFDGLDFQHINLPGVAGLPVPHLFGEARMVAAKPVTERLSPAGRKVAWNQPLVAFFG
jgi:SAM-dependent methyltransferase